MIKKEIKTDDILKDIFNTVKNRSQPSEKIKGFDLSKFKIKNDILLFNNLIYVPNKIRYEVLSAHHDFASAGHLGIQKTSELLSRNFYWPGWRKDVENFVNSCKVCMEMKTAKHKPYGELIPIDIPDCPWKIVEIDFITNLPSVTLNQEVSIMVCCDRLTKMMHLSIILGTPTAESAAVAFLKSVFYLHGLPAEIITDRGSQFTSAVWNELVNFLSIKHRTATTGHHTTIGQVERLNQSIEQYLRCFIRAFPEEDWIDWLYLAEFVYNNSKNASTGQPPFLAFNGFLPSFSPISDSVSSTLTKVYHIPDFKANYEKIHHILKASQELYINYGNKYRSSPPTISIGDLVWLRRPSNYIPNTATKLCPRKYGPFKVLETLPFLNYKLNLSDSPFSKRYDIFNICELEPFKKRPSDISGKTHSPEIKSIISCRINPTSHKCEYLVNYSDNGLNKEWINCSIIDEDDYYSEILATFNKLSFNSSV